MPRKENKFDRKSRDIHPRKLFILSVEGAKTEPQYFALFNKQDFPIQVKCLKSKHDSSPPQILAKMKKYLKKNDFEKPYEAWLVVDKDNWTDEQLLPLHKWSKKSDNYGFALSNPKFEFWLLLHFEDGCGVSNSSKCSQKLKNYLGDSGKNIDVNKISNEKIADAIDRAKKRDNPPCRNWPRSTGTTVYKLVENIQKSPRMNKARR